MIRSMTFGTTLDHAAADTVNVVGPEQPHLVALRDSGNKAPLFCFPGSGGETFAFHDMVRLLPAERPVYAVNLVAFYDSRCRFSIEDLAKSFVRLIRKEQQHGPYYLCGHSFGGYAAFDAATQLINQGEEVALLALFDSPNPALTSSLSLAESTSFRVRYLGDRFGRYGRNLLQGNLEQFFKELLSYLSKKIGTSCWSLLRSTFRLLNRPMPAVFRNSDPLVETACRAYRPSHYASRLVLFRSEARGAEFANDPTLGWNKCVAGTIDVHVVPGDHVKMMALPNVREVVRELTRYFDETAKT